MSTESPLRVTGQTHFEAYIDSTKGTNTAMQALKSMHINSFTIFDLSFASFDFEKKEPIPGLQIPLLDIQNLIQFIKTQGGKIKLSFGGNAFPFSSFLERYKPEKLAKNIAHIIKEYDLDGVDLDLEDPLFEADQTAKMIHFIRKDLPHKMISFSVPGQGWVSPYLETIPQIKEIVDSFHFMEYNIWLGEEYIEQIKDDMQQYIDRWSLSLSQIYLGLMPGKDDQQHYLSEDDAITLTKWAAQKRLGGIMLWNLNRDFEGLTGSGSMDYTHKIESILFGSKIQPKIIPQTPL